MDGDSEIEGVMDAVTLIDDVTLIVLEGDGVALLTAATPQVPVYEMSSIARIVAAAFVLNPYRRMYTSPTIAGMVYC